MFLKQNSKTSNYATQNPINANFEENSLPTPVKEVAFPLQ